MKSEQKSKDLKSDQIKKIEHHLRSYTTYKTGLAILEKQLDYIMPNMTATYDLAKNSTGTFNIKSDTEKYAIDRIESKKALDIHETMKEYHLKVDSIDEAMNELDQIERRFIELRYIKRKSVPYTANKLGYSEKHLGNLRIQIMDKLLILLKGLLHF